MTYIDMHCDTLLTAFSTNAPDGILSLPEAALDLRRMDNHVAAQFFAVFLPPRSSFAREGISEDISDLEFIERMRDIFISSIEKHSGVEFARSSNEISANMSRGISSAVLTMEDGRAVNGDLDMLRKFHDQGFRAIALTWNMENCFGYPNSKNPEEMSLGLKPFGKDAVRYMQDIGILVDVSHLSDGGFWDVSQICQKSFIASHSNCRALSPSPRNLTDEMIRSLADKGGVAGLNFLPGFIESDTSSRKTSAQSIALHARHMADVGGIGCVAIGTDFDGFSGELDVDDCTKMELLFSELKNQGFSSDDIDKIARYNVLRVMKDAIS